MSHIADMTDDEFEAWLVAFRSRCNAILARLEAIFARAGV